MSMNKYMHPRNIYHKPPDFKELAVTYPEFKQYVKLDISGKTMFDFKDPDALRSLSRTLLKKDFDLDVEIPKNKLIPTIPLRLNYILWIEDLMDFICREKDIKGVDIGTGASCVYPLLAAKKNEWSMIATESDKDSVTFAHNNVERNNLTELISIVHTSGDTLLTDIVDCASHIDFCMCNPPFFSNTQELHPFFKARSKNRPHPKNAFVASTNEVVAKGGEVEFIQRLMAESKILQNRVLIYTTMVGQKRDLPVLKKTLRDIQVSSFKETEFCQGNTTRWGLAWTFTNYDLKKALDLVKLSAKPPKCKAPLIYQLPVKDTTSESVSNMTDTILTMFKNLKMTIEEVTRNKMHQRYFLTTSSNTWSHQRRKRRERMRQTSEDSLSMQDVPEQNDNDEDEVISPAKRTIEDICENTCKKLRLSTDSDSSREVFKFMCAFNCDQDKLYLEFNTLNEDHNREYLHQILQYVKNNICKDDAKLAA
ncbi:U6 small nuclear RNA (adenine-(43)-N(6))-methyltransferase [Rhynchophorus ferrugineus]|uniref:U6 small nuclear RNA (adenine-(43)-N(6))-methyltransferase n=1 Tax=Rhynchophorus ferrugineus TaxID=354439 RepID=A0A834ICT5_RHYFE|nr:hypothetical protein GWI33_008214 [Rhynchophorus ferrugineus]